MDIVEMIQELRGEFGSKGGGRKSAIAGGRLSTPSRSSGKASAEKSRVTIYNSIDDALHKGFFGQMFSTTGSERLYVITQKKWGKSGQQTVGNKTAKGFSKGSIPSSFGDVKTYAIRTLQRHGGRRGKSLGQEEEKQIEEGTLGKILKRRLEKKKKKSETFDFSYADKEVQKQHFDFKKSKALKKKGVNVTREKITVEGSMGQGRLKRTGQSDSPKGTYSELSRSVRTKEALLKKGSTGGDVRKRKDFAKQKMKRFITKNRTQLKPELPKSKPRFIK